METVMICLPLSQSFRGLCSEESRSTFQFGPTWFPLGSGTEGGPKQDRSRDIGFRRRYCLRGHHRWRRVEFGYMRTRPFFESIVKFILHDYLVPFRFQRNSTFREIENVKPTNFLDFFHGGFAATGKNMHRNRVISPPNNAEKSRVFLKMQSLLSKICLNVEAS